MFTVYLEKIFLYIYKITNSVIINLILKLYRTTKIEMIYSSSGLKESMNSSGKALSITSSIVLFFQLVDILTAM